MNGERTHTRIVKALREARAQLEQAKSAQLEPIAVVGLGCRFPGTGETPETFWADLRQGFDAVREITPDRWDLARYYDPDADAPGKMYVREAALLKRVDEFDAAFFGISPREAAGMDPQQRLLLEVCHEALENAAIAPDSLARTRTGVFLGIGQNDYSRLATAPGREAMLSAYDGTGNGFCFASGRISYALGLQGPNLAVDTACSSSLVAVHLAVQSLRRRESDCALAAAVQLILSPEATLFLSRSKALSPDGRSRPFSADANGYGRGEGCGVLVLKRLSDARRDGDRVTALIAGSAVNHDGPSSGLTVPNPQAQETLIRQALSNAGVRPEDVGYIEAHGTGTTLGDPLELRALGAVFGERNMPLRLGSVKANIGHLEAAAGMAGLIKTILMLRHGEVPPCIHLGERNPRIPWNELPFETPVTPVAWNGDGRHIAGVSSFSLSGTNAHVVLEAAPAAESTEASDPEPHLLAISAKSPASLRALAGRMREYIEKNSGVRPADFCGTLAVGRGHYAYRHAEVVGCIEEAAQSLARWAEAEDVAPAPLAAQPPAAPVAQSADRRAMLESAAQQYREGYSIPWAELCGGHMRGRLELPTYPFDRQRFWLQPAVNTESPLGRRMSSPLVRQTVYEGSLGAASQPFLADHRIFGEIVVPGACHVSLLLGAAREALQNEALELRDVVFPEALVLGERDSVELQLVLEPMEAGSRAFTLLGRRGDVWSAHAQGSMATVAAEDLTGQYAEAVMSPGAAADLYESLAARGIELGPAFQWVEAAQAGQLTAACRMKKPASVREEMPGFPLHPGLVDSCFQLLGAALAGREEAGTYIPFRIDRVRFAPSTSRGDLHCAACFRGETRGARRVGDIWLAEDGRPLLEISGLEVRRHAGRALPLYEIVWRSITGAERTEAAYMVRDFSDVSTLPELCRRALSMVGDLKRASGRLLVCTRGGQHIGQEAVNPLQSALWGLHSVLRAEYPEWNPVIVDLDPADPREPDLAEIARYSASEDRLAIRNGEYFVPRLAPVSARSETPLPIGAGRTYLVTGGLGALGLRTAQWLCAKGASHIVLCGRNRPSAAALEIVEGLRAGGANVLIERADAARAEDVERLFRNVESAMPPIAGIVHAAGVLDDGLLEMQTFESFFRVMEPKVEGAWNLHRQTQGRELDFFVCYSSIAAVLASPGQGPYAAANAFLDGLMRSRPAGLSLGWGPWDSEGMATRGSSHLRERWQASGVNLLAPGAAISLLEAALRSGRAYAAAFDFSAMAVRLADSDMPPILSELKSTRRPVRPMREAIRREDFLASLSEADSARRFELLRNYLREQAGRVLGHQGPVVEMGESLTVLGVDSLMAVELRSIVMRELGAEVPIGRFLDGSGIRELAELLAAQTSQNGAPEMATAAQAGSWVEGEL